jgi:hypothetical protein
MDGAVPVFRRLIYLYPESEEAHLSVDYLNRIAEKTASARKASIDSLEKLLHTNGFGFYSSLFNKNHIDLEIFPNLNEDDLKEIGITSLGHRRKLIELAASIKIKGYNTQQSKSRHSNRRDPSNKKSPKKPQKNPLLIGLTKLGLVMLAGHFFGRLFGRDSGESSSFFDLDGDGVVDTVGYDRDGDGILDAFVSDTNGDGLLDTIALDENRDGLIDTVGVDSSGDGMVDFIAVDVDGDGCADFLAEDFDEDGDFDRIL